MTSPAINPTTHDNTTGSCCPISSPKDWCGRAVCSIDKCAFVLGSLLIITGIALFVLNSLYTTNYFIAATAAIGAGSGVFLLSILTHCCHLVAQSDEEQADADEEQADASKSPTSASEKDKSAAAAQESAQVSPVDMSMDAKSFFEKEGFFNLSKKFLSEVTIWRKYRAKTEGWDIDLDAGFILYGEPGNGKTRLAKAVAKFLGAACITKQCGDLKKSLYGKTEEAMSNLFDVPEGQFRVVILDEIDGLLATPETQSDLDSQTLSHFLGLVQGGKQPKYLIIGTTNHLNAIAEAVQRDGRLGQHFEVKAPDQEARTKIFQYYLNQLNLSPEEDWSKYAQHLSLQTDGLSYASIAAYVADAQKTALSLSASDRSYLSQTDFKAGPINDPTLL